MKGHASTRCLTSPCYRELSPERGSDADVFLLLPPLTTPSFPIVYHMKRTTRSSSGTIRIASFSYRHRISATPPHHTRMVRPLHVYIYHPPPFATHGLFRSLPFISFTSRSVYIHTSVSIWPTNENRQQFHQSPLSAYITTSPLTNPARL